MRERVAFQVALEICEIHGEAARGWKWPDDFSGDVIDRARSRAYEIIAAMREPDETMLAADGVFTNCCTCGGHAEGWEALIHAALL